MHVNSCEIFSIFFTLFLWNPPALELFITKPLESKDPEKPFENSKLRKPLESKDPEKPFENSNPEKPFEGKRVLG